MSHGAQDKLEQLAEALYASGDSALVDAVSYDDLTTGAIWRYVTYPTKIQCPLNALLIVSASSSFLRLVHLAAWSAKQVYSLASDADITRHVANPPSGPGILVEAKPSGAAKNWALFCMKPGINTVSTTTFSFAVRGTSTSAILEILRDNSTNLDAQPIGLGDQLDLMVHRGFKAAGLAIFESFTDAVDRFWTEEQGAGEGKANLVLTGHSAGGGTIYFLYVNLLKKRPDILQRCEYENRLEG